MNRTLTLLYHDVSDDPASTGFQSVSARKYTQNVKQFTKQIEMIHMRATTKRIKNYDELKYRGDKILLTFDDGGESFLQISKILDEYSLKGLFFISTKFIGRKTFMTESDIKTLHQNGHLVGSHSHSHPGYFHKLDSDIMMEELISSKNILENIVGTEIQSFSIPGGQASRKVFDSAIRAGYKYIFTSDPSLAVREYNNSFIVGRVSITKNTKDNDFENYLRYSGILRESIIRYVKKYGRRIIDQVLVKEFA